MRKIPNTLQCHQTGHNPWNGARHVDFAGLRQAYISMCLNYHYFSECNSFISVGAPLSGFCIADLQNKLDCGSGKR